jgi:serine/threonine protein kinase
VNQKKRYSLISRIAEGGMSEIWLARPKVRDKKNERVIIKSLRPELAKNAAVSSMFKRESELSAHLKHPNIVSIIDTGTISGKYFIATEYVNGITLRACIDQCTKTSYVPPVWAALRIIGAVCKGLEHVHRATDANGKWLGIIHQDLTPENVMISFAGEVKILDFGALETSAYVHRTYGIARHGKYPYMSPEALQNENIDQRSDLYSIGVMLYELLSGRLPFKGDGPDEYIHQVIAQKPTPPGTNAPWIDKELEAIAVKAIAFAPEQRYQSVSEFLAAIIAYLGKYDTVRESMEMGLFAAALAPEDPSLPVSKAEIVSGWPETASMLAPATRARCVWLHQLLNKGDAPDENNPYALIRLSSNTQRSAKMRSNHQSLKPATQSPKVRETGIREETIFASNTAAAPSGAADVKAERHSPERAASRAPQAKKAAANEDAESIPAPSDAMGKNNGRQEPDPGGEYRSDGASQKQLRKREPTESEESLFDSIESDQEDEHESRFDDEIYAETQTEKSLAQLLAEEAAKDAAEQPEEGEKAGAAQSHLDIDISEKAVFEDTQSETSLAKLEEKESENERSASRTRAEDAGKRDRKKQPPDNVAENRPATAAGDASEESVSDDVVFWSDANAAREAWIEAAGKSNIASFFESKVNNYKDDDTKQPFAMGKPSDASGNAPAAKPDAIEPAFASERGEVMLIFDNGVAAIRRRDYAAALELFQQALAIAPENKLIKTNLRRVEKFMGNSDERESTRGFR